MSDFPEKLAFTVSERVARNADELFRAIADPGCSCRYFMTAATGPMEAGRTVEWRWPSGRPVEVHVDRAEPGKELVFRWRAHEVDYETLVRISFEPDEAAPGVTRVVLHESGWTPDAQGLASSYEHATGWQHMLQGLKIWSMHGIDHRAMDCTCGPMPFKGEPVSSAGILPEFRTPRLVLRAQEERDLPAIREIHARFEVARYTLRVPHPYPPGAEVEWLRQVRRSIAQGIGAVWAIALGSTDEMIGGIGLRIDRTHGHAELGYSLGLDHWGKGYATEAVQPIVDHAFQTLGLQKVIAEWYTMNPASGRVLDKCGFTRLCTRMRHVTRWGEWFDVVVTELMREDWENRRAQ